MADVEIKGMRELYTALSTQIPRKMEGRLLQKALAAGTAEIVKRARANIRNGASEIKDGLRRPYPVSRTGALRRAIYAARGKKSNATQEVRIVNVRKGGRAAKSGRNAYYARWVEYGHRISRRGLRLNRRNKEDAPRGRVDPKPFMRPAWDSGQQTAVSRIYERLRVLVENAIQSSRF